MPIGGQGLIEIPRYFNSEEGGKIDVVIILNKILYGQVKYARPW